MAPGLPCPTTSPLPKSRPTAQDDRSSPCLPPFTDSSRWLTAMIPRLALISLCLTTGAALGHSAAVSSFRSRSLRSEASSVYSVWDANDVCSQPVKSNTTYGEDDVTCSLCLTRPDCAIESTTGKCVTVSLIDTRVNVEYVRAGNASYCDSSDAACTACRADAKDATSAAVCRGSSGCVCVHQCELASVTTSEPSLFTSSYFFHALIVLGILAPVLVMTRLYKSLTANLMSTTERELVRERERARHEANPLTMKLDGWRSFMKKELKEQPETNGELKLCPTRLSDESSSRCSTLQMDESAEDSSFASAEGCAQISTFGQSTGGQRDRQDESNEGEHAYETLSTPRSLDGQCTRPLH